MFGFERTHVVEHEADEAVAFTLDAGHHLATIDADLALWMNAEPGSLVNMVHRFGGGDQQLGGHAADAGTGGAVRAPFNHHHLLTMGLGGAVGAQTCGTPPYHGNIYFNSVHAHSLNWGCSSLAADLGNSAATDGW